MLVVRAIVTAFSFFSAIPMPYLEWDDANMRYMMAAFPLVGLVIGALWWLWGQASFAASFGAMLRGVGFALVPVLVTGGIHLDGMADVIDAQSSHASPERKREILKDPHVGSFAIIGTCSYLMAFAALASELNAAQLPALTCIPIVSRCLSGLVTVTLRTSKSEGMLAAEQASADARVVRLVLACAWVAATAYLLVTAPAAALLATVASWAVVASVWHLAKTQFGGMSGDLAGYLLQMVELAMLAALVVNGRLWWS
jgi:adenosylcobinamide-GDP ribazoletransferase